MSIIKSEDGNKWINSFLAIVGVIVAFIVISFIEQLGEWFDLEASIGNFTIFAQGVGILAGLGTFIYIVKNKVASTHLNEVYSELVKVIWPDRDSVLKVTFGLVIGLSIVSCIFVLIDFSFRKLLEFIY